MESVWVMPKDDCIILQVNGRVRRLPKDLSLKEVERIVKEEMRK
jgi:hypothetical protein